MQTVKLCSFKSLFCSKRNENTDTDSIAEKMIKLQKDQVEAIQVISQSIQKIANTLERIETTLITKLNES